MKEKEETTMIRKKNIKKRTREEDEISTDELKEIMEQVDTALRDYEKNHKTYTLEEVTKKLR